jgi:hypothetical protein
MSKRERYIGIATIAVVGILALDRLVVTPLIDRKSDLDTRLSSARDDMDAANRLFATSRRLQRDWRDMTGAALRNPNDHKLKSTESDAESQILNSIGEWAQYSGFNVQTTKRERTEKEKDFVKLTYRVTATATMRQVGEFLWRIQTTPVPVRVTDIQMNSRKDGTDDLAVQLGIATIYLPPPPPDNTGPGNNAHPTNASASARD